MLQRACTSPFAVEKQKNNNNIVTTSQMFIFKSSVAVAIVTAWAP